MAEIKAESDVCVTSSNALKIVKKLPNKDIFFIPDENLGRFIAKKVPEKHFIFNDGFAMYIEYSCGRCKESKRAGIRGSCAGASGVYRRCAGAGRILSEVPLQIIDYATNSDEKVFLICSRDGRVL